MFITSLNLLSGFAVPEVQQKRFGEEFITNGVIQSSLKLIDIEHGRQTMNGLCLESPLIAQPCEQRAAVKNY